MELDFDLRDILYNKNTIRYFSHPDLALELYNIVIIQCVEELHEHIFKTHIAFARSRTKSSFLVRPF